MTFKNIYDRFIKSTKENFPVSVCTKQNKRENNVFESEKLYLCLVIDSRFSEYWNLIILRPYICKESDAIITYGWVNKSGHEVYGNIENSTQLYDEFVVGFQEYEEDRYTKLWDSFIESIEKQLE